MGSGLSFLLKVAGNRGIAQILYKFPGLFLLGVKLASPFYARDGVTWYEMFEKDMSSTTMESFFAIFVTCALRTCARDFTSSACR